MVTTTTYNTNISEGMSDLLIANRVKTALSKTLLAAQYRESRKSLRVAEGNLLRNKEFVDCLFILEDMGAVARCASLS